MLQIKINSNSEFTFDTQNGEVELNGEKKNIDLIKVSKNNYHLIKDDKSFNIEIVEHSNKEFVMLVNGKEYTSSVQNDLDLLLDKMGISAANNVVANDLKSPMPGLVLDIKVKVGQEVKEGDALVVLEAMKMENILKSPADVIIKSIEVEKGVNVEKNAVLVEFE